MHQLNAKLAFEIGSLNQPHVWTTYFYTQILFIHRYLHFIQFMIKLIVNLKEIIPN